jgi:hypothetical protein
MPCFASLCVETHTEETSGFEPASSPTSPNLASPFFEPRLGELLEARLELLEDFANRLLTDFLWADTEGDNFVERVEGVFEGFFGDGFEGVFEVVFECVLSRIKDSFDVFKCVFSLINRVGAKPEEGFESESKSPSSLAATCAVCSALSSFELELTRPPHSPPFSPRFPETVSETVFETTTSPAVSENASASPFASTRTTGNGVPCLNTNAQAVTAIAAATLVIVNTTPFALAKGLR